MFENLSEKLQSVFAGFKSKGRLTEADVDAGVREIRMALLEADVNYKVAKSFCARVRERCLTAEIMESLTPGQNVVKVVLDEMTALLGGDTAELRLGARVPSVIMLVGLQGSGKTTACAKLAYRLEKQGHSPLLVACDVHRPAAADQLATLASEIGVRIYRAPADAYAAADGTAAADGAAATDGSAAADAPATPDRPAAAAATATPDPVRIARDGVRDAIDSMRDVVIIDTAGRLHVDEEMMAEAEAIKEATEPDETLMVVDAMTGQDIVSVVSAFSERLDFDGVIISKLDGDARGGGALSVREVTGKPVKFVSAGERPDSLETFHPDRMAKRILGMADVVSVIERAVEVQEEADEAAAAASLAKSDFDFNDFLEVVGQTRKMGGLSSLVGALPGGSKAVADGAVDEGELDRSEAIINSMTPAERAKPTLLNGSRRARIAKGCGLSVTEVNTFIRRFNETRKQVKKMMVEFNQSGGKGKKRRRRMQVPGLGTVDMSAFKDLM